jgi:uncharacterized peroxidase-related enzyme
VPPQDADGVLGEAYAWQAQRTGEPAQFTQLGSLYPELVLERLRFYKVVDEAPSGLSAQERSLVAFVVSRLNETPHCSSGLRHKLRDVGTSEQVVDGIDAHPDRPATGESRLDTILGYAVKLTSAPGSVEEADISSLRDVGLSDLDILDLNNVTAYYNYVNRVANGLGLRSDIPAEHALTAVPH